MGDWRVRFGSNLFLVGRAIQRCITTLRAWIADIELGRSLVFVNTLSRLRKRCPFIHLAKKNGEEYNGPYPLWNQYIRVQTAGIDVTVL